MYEKITGFAVLDELYLFRIFILDTVSDQQDTLRRCHMMMFFNKEYTCVYVF